LGFNGDMAGRGGRIPSLGFNQRLATASLIFPLLAKIRASFACGLSGDVRDTPHNGRSRDNLCTIRRNLIVVFLFGHPGPLAV
jgi:hypothetical protein